TVSVEPSTASIGPRRRTVCGCCADADEVASAATTAAPASRRRVVLPMLFLRKWLRAVTSGRHAQDKTGRGSWTYMGGVMPSRPTETAAASSVPSSFLLAAAMKIFEPGLSSLLS